MKSPKPPAIATWILEHLLVGKKHEALVGDLSEEFSRGRSVAWYWRQVFVAILVGLSKELIILWVAGGFTIVWMCALYASGDWLIHISRSRLFGTVFGWGLRFAWPLSEIYAITLFAALAAVPLLISLTIYLWATRHFNLRVLSQGIFVGMLGFAFSYVGLMLLPSPLRGSGSLPLFVGLMLSLWAVRPTAKGVGVARISS